MRLITNEEFVVVGGGDSDFDWSNKPIINGSGGDPDLGAWNNIGGFDAAATRSPGTNTWGQTAADVQAEKEASTPQATLQKDLSQCPKGDEGCYTNAYEKWMQNSGVKP
ncbi:hypothetical protein [Undibacterium pigrum]|uniref:Uncharacterized protein n=1 Tax=Undibacterium pigrum TaxID=401470 RepID=A0A318J4N9_9BURK|nr:hypothetical protein [Undibacterium pigrum]PXX41600.1 hypothetical protein DFR42_107251 [Undibacterium pigrum]